MDKHVCTVCKKDTKGGTYTGPVGHSVVVKTRRLAAAEVCLECCINIALHHHKISGIILPTERNYRWNRQTKRKSRILTCGFPL